MQLVGSVIFLGIIALIIYGLIKSIDVITVWDYEKGLKYEKGRFKGLVEPGVYVNVKPFHHIARVDTRLQYVVVPAQEVLTSDAVAVKVSLSAKHQITDPRIAIQENSDYQQAFYLILQTALREIVASQAADELLEKRASFDEKLTEKSTSLVGELGIELLSVKIRDITFPGELKKAFAQVVMARKEGQAALERARGETAALRSLANAARMIDKNPALMQLRAIQAVGSSPGSTLVFGMPDDTRLMTKPETKNNVEVCLPDREDDSP